MVQRLHGQSPLVGLPKFLRPLDKQDLNGYTQSGDLSGYAPIDSPNFTGDPQAPTPSPGDNDYSIATTAYVQGELIKYAPIDSPVFTGNPQAPTPSASDNDTSVATTAFVKAAVGAVTAGVSSFNTRTGAVTLTLSDVTSVGGSPLASPIFTGDPQAPTPAPGDNDTSIATTAFVQAAVAGGTAGVSSFNTRTGAVTLTLSDVTSVGGAPIDSPVFTTRVTLSSLAIINGLKNTERVLNYDSNGLLRWQCHVTSATETGTSSTGSDYAISRYNDVGNIIDTPLSISRSTGLISVVDLSVSRSLTFNSLGAATITLNGPNMTNKGLILNTGALNRWMVISDAEQETGTGNAGSNFLIQRFDDTGAVIDNPLFISRSTGFVTLGGAVTVGGPTNGNLNITGAAGNNRNLVFKTGTLNRWTLQVNSAAESGNVGSDFYIWRYDINGAVIDSPLTINRANGAVTLSSALIAGNNVTANGGTLVANNAAGATLALQGPAGTTRQIVFYNTGPLAPRWTMYASGEAEGTGNAGSNFWISRYNDAGAGIDSPFSINRATGQVTIGAGGMTVNGNFAATGTLWSNSSLTLNGLPATNRSLIYTTNGVNRWWVIASADAEGTGNVGSDYCVWRANDAGSLVDIPLRITRSSGAVTIGAGGLTANGNVTATGITCNGYAQIGNATTAQGLGVYGFINATSYVTVGGYLSVTGTVGIASGSLTVGTATLGGQPVINLQGAAGSSRVFYYYSGTTPRWALFTTSAGESGSNVGSDFYINRYTDAGVGIDAPFTITRANGLVSMNTCNVNNLLQALQLNVTGAGAAVNCYGVAGNNRGLFVYSGGSLRWQVLGDGAAEPGGGTNVGTNFAIARYNDAGTYVDEPLTIARNTGVVTISSSGTNGLLTLNQAAPASANVDINWNSGGAQRWVTSCRSLAGTLDWWLFNNNTGATVISAGRANNVCTFIAPIVNGSDLRTKEEIEPVAGALGLVEKLNGVFFKSKTKGLEDRRQVGLVAQDVREILPEVVFEGETESADGPMLGIAYSPLVAVLIEAVKELSAKVKSLEAAMI